MDTNMDNKSVNPSAKDSVPVPATHYVEKRPWGQYEILDQFMVSDGSGNDVAVKRHNMKPGGAWSYQIHKFRSEVWIFVQGYGTVVLNDEKREVKAGDVVQFPVGTKHRFINNKDQETIIIEVMTGHYDEDDNTRLEDNYGRV